MKSVFDLITEYVTLGIFHLTFIQHYQPLIQVLANYLLLSCNSSQISQLIFSFR